LPTSSSVSPAATHDPPVPAADLRACRISMRVTGQHSLARRKYLSVALRADEPCRVTVTAKTFAGASARLRPGTRTVVKIRRCTNGSRRIVVNVRAVDAGGNVTTATYTVRAGRPTD